MFLALLLIVADPAPAANADAKPPAKAPNTFATPGDMVWTSGTSFRFSASAPMMGTQPAAMATASSTNDFAGEATLALALDYFLVKRVSLGAFVRAGYAWSSTSYGPGFGVGPRVGYLAPFSDWVAIWPRLDLSFGAQATFVRPTATNAQASATTWFLNAALHLPLVFSILQHVVLGIGPYFALEPQWIQGNPNLNAFALNFGVSSFIGWHH